MPRLDRSRGLGLKIQYLRKQACLTQSQLAKKVGVSDKFIGFVEQGRRTPSIKFCSKLAKALGVRLKVLFDF